MTVCRLRSRSKSLSLSIILFLFSCITFHISILYVLCYHFLFLPASQSLVGFIEFVSDSPTSSLDTYYLTSVESIPWPRRLVWRCCWTILSLRRPGWSSRRRSRRPSSSSARGRPTIRWSRFSSRSLLSRRRAELVGNQ